MRGVLMVDLPQFSDARGHLVALEGGRYLPFDVCRVFVVWGSSAEAVRGEDAMSCHEALLALRGEVTVDLDSGSEQMTVRLTRPSELLCLHAGIHVRMRDFSPDAVVVAAASRKHAETERYRSPQPALLSGCEAARWA